MSEKKKRFLGGLFSRGERQSAQASTRSGLSTRSARDSGSNVPEVHIVERRPQDSPAYWDALRNRLQSITEVEARALSTNFSVVLDQGDSPYLSGSQMTLNPNQLRQMIPAENVNSIVGWYYQFLTADLLKTESYYSQYSQRTVTNEQLLGRCIDRVNRSIDALTYPLFLSGRAGSSVVWNVHSIISPRGGMVDFVYLKQRRQQPLESYAHELERTYAGLGMSAREFLEVPSWYASQL